MALGKGSFGQMPIVQPPKMGSFGQYTHRSWSISLLTYRPLFSHFGVNIAKNAHYLGKNGGKLSV